MKRLLLALLLIGTGTLFTALSAQDVPLVDIASAQAEIAQLDKDMADLNAENDKLNADTKSQQDGIDGSQKELKEVLTLIDNARYQRLELKDFRLTIKDDKLLAKVDEGLVKLDKAIQAASDRRNSINQENTDRTNKIRANNTQADLNKRAIDRKTSRKNNLLASIDKTKAQDARFQAQMSKIDAFLAGTPATPAK